MKSYDQALNEIYSMANEQIAKSQRHKQKRQKIFILVVPVCFLLVISLSICVGMGVIKPPTDDGNEENIADQTPVEDNKGDENIFWDGENMQPNIYPSAWKKLNAVIVKWGEPNEQTWSESYGKYASYDEKAFMVEYVGVNVEFLTVYSETMKESLIPNIENIIEQTTYLMIPKYYIEEIKVGDIALVFLDSIANVAVQASDGSFYGLFTTILGIRCGDCIAEDKYVPAPIFNIVNNKLVISENFYEVNPDNGEYYMDVMNLLLKANEYICKNDSTELVIFENGISVEDLSDLFEYICENK